MMSTLQRGLSKINPNVCMVEMKVLFTYNANEYALPTHGFCCCCCEYKIIKFPILYIGHSKCLLKIHVDFIASHAACIFILLYDDNDADDDDDGVKFTEYHLSIHTHMYIYVSMAAATKPLYVVFIRISKSLFFFC